MRTTINVEDDAYAVAEAYARARALKLGQAVSELIRLGSANRLKFKQVLDVQAMCNRVGDGVRKNGERNGVIKTGNSRPDRCW